MGYQDSNYGSVAASGKILLTAIEQQPGFVATIEGKPFNIRPPVVRNSAGNYVVNIGTADGSDGVDILNRAVHLTPTKTSIAPIMIAVENALDPDTGDNKVHVLSFSAIPVNGLLVPTDTSFSISVVRTAAGAP